MLRKTPICKSEITYRVYLFATVGEEKLMEPIIKRDYGIKCPVETSIKKLDGWLLGNLLQPLDSIISHVKNEIPISSWKMPLDSVSAFGAQWSMLT